MACRAEARTGLGTADRPGVCPGRTSVKADGFSGRQTHRGNSQEPRSWTAGRRETEVLKPVDKPIRGWGASHRAGMKVNARWPRKVGNSRGRARFRRAKAAWCAAE